MQNINQYIEHTILKANATHKDIDRIVQEALEYQFKGICVPPFWVKKARKGLADSEVQLVTVSGFPFGYNKTETKVFEIEEAIRDGADEVDIVWNLSAYNSEMSWVKQDIAKCADVLHDHGKYLKVILETAYLTKEGIEAGCNICKDAGADFVKTSTGFAHEGAMVENIKIMRAALPSSVGIKAAGGIKDLETTLAMIKAGADRIGTSSGVAIVEEARASQGMTGHKKNLQINISGRVQGVGFRYSALHKAQQLGVNGFVKNMYDGSVFIEAEADEISMDHFLIWCNKGPTFSRVEKVSITEGIIKNYTSFTVKH